MGELLEPSTRTGSDRRLYYRLCCGSRLWVEVIRRFVTGSQDITFAVFRNKNGKAEFAAQLAQDAKVRPGRPTKGRLPRSQLSSFF